MLGGSWKISVNENFEIKMNGFVKYFCNLLYGRFPKL